MTLAKEATAGAAVASTAITSYRRHPSTAAAHPGCLPMSPDVQKLPSGMSWTMRPPSLLIAIPATNQSHRRWEQLDAWQFQAAVCGCLHAPPSPTLAQPQHCALPTSPPCRKTPATICVMNAAHKMAAQWHIMPGTPIAFQAPVVLSTVACLMTQVRVVGG